MPLDVAASEFSRNFGRWKLAVQTTPIAVTSHGHVAGYFVSPETFERIQRITMASRQAFHPAELPQHLADALEGFAPDPGKAGLEELMRD